MADNIFPFLLMTPIQAAHFREQTRTAQHRLDPVLVRGGPFKDRYVLPSRVSNDPNHADKLVGLTLLTEVVMDIDVAFPPEPEV